MCPYAVVSFQYKGKEAAATPMTAHRYIFLQEMVTLSKYFQAVGDVCKTSVTSLRCSMFVNKFFVFSLTGLTLFPLKEVEVKHLILYV